MHRPLSRTQLILVAAVAVATLLAAPTDALAVADVQFDTMPCSAVDLWLPEDGELLPEMPVHGIVLAVRQYGGTPAQLEAAVTITILDAMGAAVAGQTRYVESSSSFVWTPEVPLTVGEFYSVQVDVDRAVLDPEQCDFRSLPTSYGYGVKIVDPADLASPRATLELAGQHYRGDLACCQDVPRSCDPADFARDLVLRSVVQVPSAAWSAAEARFFIEGAADTAVTESADVSSGAALVTATLPAWDEASPVCVAVTITDLIDGAQTEAAPTCLNADEIDAPPPLEEAVCAAEPTDTTPGDTAFADTTPGGADAGPTGAMPQAPGDTDCACAVRGAQGGSSRLPLGVALGLLGAGLVLRRRRHV